MGNTSLLAGLFQMDWLGASMPRGAMVARTSVDAARTCPGLACWSAHPLHRMPRIKPWVKSPTATMAWKG